MTSLPRALLCLAALVAGCERMTPAARVPAESAQQTTAQSLLGDWYNTEIGHYPTPSITFVRFHPAGGIVIGGLDGSQRYGQYNVAPDGTLRVRIAERSRASVILDEVDAGSEGPRLRPRPSRLIIDSAPVVSDQSLELQARGRIFMLTRDPQQKARLEAGMLAYREAHAQALLRAEAARRQEEAAQETARLLERQLSGDLRDGDDEEEDEEEDEDERAEAPARRVTVRFSGAGAGSSACTGALLQQLSRPGLRVSADNAEALLEVELSGIAYRRGTWGRYHEVEYRARISDRHHQLLASLEATETAGGSSAFEVCGDIGEDLGDELEDLLED